MYPSCDTIYTGVMLNVEITRTIFLFVVYVSPVPSLVVIVTIIVLFRIHTSRIYWLVVLCIDFSRECADAYIHTQTTCYTYSTRKRTIIRAKVRQTRVYTFTKLHYIIPERKEMTFVCEKERRFYLKNKIHFKLIYQFLRNERSLFLNM